MPDYIPNLIDKKGTIYNTQTGKGYSSEAQLASDLGVKVGGIDWSRIQKNPNYTPGGQSLNTWETGYVGTGQQPTTTGDINMGNAQVNLPGATTPTTTTDKISALEASQKTFLDYQMQSAKDAQKQKEMVQSQLQSQQSALAEMGQSDSAAIRAQANIDLGVNELITQKQAILSEIDALNTKISGIEDQRIAELDANTARTTDMGQINLGAEKINEKYDKRIMSVSSLLNSKAALLSAQTQSIAEARSFAQQAVEDYVFDKQMNVDNLRYFIDSNQDLLSSLSSTEQDAINTMYSVQAQELESIKSEKSQVMELAIQYPRAGINLDMTVDQAVNATIPFAQEAEARAIAQENAELARTRQLSSPSAPSVDTIPWSQWAFDAGLVGLTESQANDVTTLEKPPAWFTNQVMAEQGSLNGLQTKWDAKRALTQAKEQELSKEDKVAAIWQWMGDPEGGLNLDPKDQKLFIKQSGFDPQDFGFYTS